MQLGCHNPDACGSQTRAKRSWWYITAANSLKLVLLLLCWQPGQSPGPPCWLQLLPAGALLLSLLSGGPRLPLLDARLEQACSILQAHVNHDLLVVQYALLPCLLVFIDGGCVLILSLVSGALVAASSMHLEHTQE